MRRSNDNRLLHTLFEQQAKKSPDAIALYEGELFVSFCELDDRASRIAGGLHKRGVRAGATVGLHLDRSIEWVAGILGILKAGAAVVPLPPSYPAKRLRAILDYAGLDLVIDAPQSPLDQRADGNVVSISTLLAADPTSPGEAGIRPSQTAFVLCSSGSTGVPKMIARCHQSFMHRLDWTWQAHPFAATDLCCQKAQSTTTHAVYELFEPLLKGVPVVIIGDEDVRNLEVFWKTIAERKVSRLLIVPSALHASLQIAGFAPPPINVMVIMGEYVDQSLAERILEAFPDTHIYSIYGSTEASSMLLCDVRTSWRRGEALPLGFPITDGIETRILDEAFQTLPAGEVGRLYVAGAPLFDEYFRDPALTDTVLVHLPGESRTFYDTRDLAKVGPDGSLQFVGRVDHTVKIRGFRVDLQEVENALASQADVAQAAVMVDTDGNGNTSLLAFVTPADVPRSAVFDAARSQLPDYMVPSTLVALDAFPTTSRAKLDRKKLLADYRDHRVELDASGLSDTEQSVAAAWRAVLGHTHFDADNSFFEVGGTSLIVFSLVSQLRDQLMVDDALLSVKTVYRYPTVRALARYIDDVRRGVSPVDEGVSPILVSLKQATDSGLAPLFLMASAGGTLGAYEKLATTLSVAREIVGVRDPYILGEREPTEGFQQWVERYITAIRSRQASGPYFIGAYSSAGSFGYEIARRIEADGEQVQLLILIDPLALDRSDRSRFGWWALRATYSSRRLRFMVRLAGWLRRVWLITSTARRNAPIDNNHAVDAEEFQQIRQKQLNSKNDLIMLSNLIELNTGLPFAISGSDLAGRQPGEYLDVLKARFDALMPEVDHETVERIVTQYPLQVLAQHAYRLQPYEGKTILFEPKSRYAGLLKALLQPHLKRLTASTIKVGERSSAEGRADFDFGALDPHYRCMRDDVFVEEVAKQLSRLLK